MNETKVIDIKDLAKGVLKRAWIVVLCGVLAAAICLVYTKNFVTPTYRASVTMYVNNNADNSDTVSSSNLAVALQLVKTYVNIINSDTVLDKVVDQTGFNLTAAQVRGMMLAQVVGDTEMFTVSITSPDPQMSADIVNAISSIGPTEISKIIEGSSAKVVDFAKVPTSQYAPSYTIATILGGVAGVALSTFVIVVLLLFNNRVKDEKDLMAICNIPVLGAIPDFAECAKQAELMEQKKEGRKA